MGRIQRAFDRVIFVGGGTAQEALAHAISRIEDYQLHPKSRLDQLGIGSALWVNETLVLSVPANGFFKLAPVEDIPKHLSLDTLPWIPKSGFSWNVSEKIRYSQAEIDTLTQIVRTARNVYLATEPDSSAHHSAIEFLALEVRLPEVKLMRYPIDADDATIGRALNDASTVKIEPSEPKARRARSEADYLWKVNLRHAVVELLKNARYAIDRRKDDLGLSLVGVAVLGAISRRDDAMRASAPRPRWQPVIVAQPATEGDKQHVVGQGIAFTFDPQPGPEVELSQVTLAVEAFPKRFFVNDVTHEELDVQPPDPYTLATLAVDLEQGNPEEWTPERLQTRLSDLYDWGCITRPWRSVPVYPAWSAERSRFVLSEIAKMIPALADVARQIRPIDPPAGAAPRAVAITPVGRQLRDAAKVYVEAMSPIARRWMAHLLGNAKERRTTITAYGNGIRVVARYRTTLSPGWMLAHPDMIKEPLSYVPRIGDTLEVIARDILDRPEGGLGWYTIGALLGDFMEPERLCQSDAEREALIPGGRLCSPEHLLQAIHKLITEEMVERVSRDGTLRLTERGAAAAALLPPLLRAPLFAINVRTGFARAERDEKAIDKIREYNLGKLRALVGQMCKTEAPKNNGWTPGRSNAKTRSA